MLDQCRNYFRASVLSFLESILSKFVFHLWIYLFSPCVIICEFDFNIVCLSVSYFPSYTTFVHVNKSVHVYLYSVAVCVTWISTYSFLVSYLPNQAAPNDQPTVVMIIGSVSIAVIVTHSDTVYIYIFKKKKKVLLM